MKTDKCSKRIEKEERDREDLSFYRGDPDAGRSEEDLRSELEMEDGYD